MRRREVLAAMGGWVGAVACGTGAAWGADRPEGAVDNGRGKSAFWRAVGDRHELCVMDGRGEPRAVFVARGLPQLGRRLVWSPSGEWLAFAAVHAMPGRAPLHRIFVVAADGSQMRCITPPAQNEIDPCWSPDGEHVACVRLGTGDSAAQIHTARRDGTQRRALGAVPSGQAATMAADGRALLGWSADGARVTCRVADGAQTAFGR